MIKIGSTPLNVNELGYRNFKTRFLDYIDNTSILS